MDEQDKKLKRLRMEIRGHSRFLLELATRVGHIATLPARIDSIVDEIVRGVTGRSAHTGEDRRSGVDPFELLLRRVVREKLVMLLEQARALGGASQRVNAAGWALDVIADHVNRAWLSGPLAPRSGKEGRYEAVLEALATKGAKLEVEHRGDGAWIRVDAGQWFHLPPREWAVLELLSGNRRLGDDGTALFWSLGKLTRALGLGNGRRGRQNVRNRISALRKTLLEHRVNPFYLERKAGGVRFLLRDGYPPPDPVRPHVRLGVARRARS